MGEVNLDNVCYLDEYPHLLNKVQLKHCMTPRSIGARVLLFTNEQQQLTDLQLLMEEVPNGYR